MLSIRTRHITILLLLVLGAVAGIQGSYITGPSISPITPSLGIPGFVQGAEAHATSGSSLAVSFSVTPLINDVVLVFTTNPGTGTDDRSVSVADNQVSGGNAYAQLNTIPNNNGSLQRNQIWCSVVTKSTGTFTVTETTPSNSQPGIVILEYNHTTCNGDVLTGAVTNTSPYNCGSAVTSNPNDLLITFLTLHSPAGSPTFTAPTNFTIEKQQNASASGQVLAVADRVVAVTATYTPTFAASTNNSQSPCSFVALISH